MGRKAFTLIEILVVIGIILVIAALLFPVFSRSLDETKLTRCATRLHQFAGALALYRADNNDKGYVWSIGKSGTRAPYSIFEGMKSYLGDGSVLYCQEPNPDPVTAWELVHYVTFNNYSNEDPHAPVVHIPPAADPGVVVAYCSNHAKGNGPLRNGSYNFVREDTSAKTTTSASMTVMYYDKEGWHETPGEFRGTYLRFAGQTWPPVPEL